MGGGPLEVAYGESIGALHSLLDSLVDRREDHESGPARLLDYYAGPVDSATQLASLATRAKGATENLRRHHAHRVILTAMCSYYLSAPECTGPEAETIRPALDQRARVAARRRDTDVPLEAPAFIPSLAAYTPRAQEPLCRLISKPSA